jgi:hypothetical protein
MKILLGYIKVKLGKEDIFKTLIGKLRICQLLRKDSAPWS